MMKILRIDTIGILVLLVLINVGCTPVAPPVPPPPNSTVSPVVGTGLAPTMTSTLVATGTSTMTPTATPTVTPTAVPSFRINIIAVSTGTSHTCALTSAGGVKCWGFNYYGQLGDGTTIDRHEPVNVSGLSSGVTFLSARVEHTCVLTSIGGVKCWGENNYGQLGNNTTVDQNTPVDVFGLTSGVRDIATGTAHSCALKDDGTIWCWGLNNFGQLGDGTTKYSLKPVAAATQPSKYISVSVGDYSTCGLTNQSGVKCWGGNINGQLGDGTTAVRATPVDVTGLSSGVLVLNSGYYHSCALMSLGGVKCWGLNQNGQLGDGTTIERHSPVDVMGLTNGSRVVSISAGSSHTCALNANGGVKCWGWNKFGQLGDGSNSDHSSPVDVSGLSSGIDSISAGGGHTCAVTTIGGIKCWGSNYYGQLGDGTTIDPLIPIDVIGFGDGIIAISAGGYNTCILTAGGRVKCWGWNNFGQIGDGTNINRLTPVDVTGLTSGVIAISSGGDHTCALTATGGVKCWGQNNYGQLGDGTNINRLTPVDVIGLTSGVMAISSGGDNTCALTESGGVKCWGNNGMGQLGDFTTINRSTPVNVYGLTSGIRTISAGLDQSCALTSGGGVKCWGYGSPSIATDVTGLTSGTVAITSGYMHTCAIPSGGGVVCFGVNGMGELGDGTTINRSTPVYVIGLTSGVFAVSAGMYDTCALTASGGVKCWGNNMNGQLGDGTTINRSTPVDVIGLTSGVFDVSAAGNHTCALTATGGVKCWGYNLHGELGDGTNSQRLSPVYVIGLIP